VLIVFSMRELGRLSPPFEIQSQPHSAPMQHTSLPTKMRAWLRNVRWLSSAQSAPLPTQRATNSFKKLLPEIFDSQIYFKKGLRSVSRLKCDQSISNRLTQQKKYSIVYLNNLMDSLTVPLTQILFAYRKCFAKLHPFEVTARLPLFLTGPRQPLQS
jgi:hypothetical protein